MRATYTAVVRVDSDHHLDVETLAALEEFEASLTTSDEGWPQIRLTLTATNLSHACLTAISVATAATGAPAVACEVTVAQQSGELQRLGAESRRTRGG